MQDFITNTNLGVRSSPVALAPGQVYVQSAQYEELLAIADIWDRARAVLADAQNDATQIREQYRQEGITLGRADAQRQALEQIAQMQGSMSQWVKNTDAQLIELVNRCVGEVVNKIDPTLLVSQSVEKGLAELVDAAQIMVRVHPNSASIEDLVEAAVKQYGITGHVRIVPDGSLKEGDVVVESPVGVVDLRLEKQLAHISKALKP